MSDGLREELKELIEEMQEDPWVLVAQRLEDNGGLREALHGWIREEIERANKFHAATKGNGHQAGDTCDGWTALTEAEQMLHDDAHELLDTHPAALAVPLPVDREALAELAAEWKQNADEDERYLSRAHASEVLDVYASIRINREHADAVLALLGQTDGSEEK